MALQVQRKRSVNLGRLIATAVVALAFVAQPMYGLVAGKVADAAPNYESGTVRVSSSDDFEEALANSSVSHITIDGDFSVDHSIVISRGVTIQGGGHTITGPGSEKEYVKGGDNYVIKVWNATERVTINSLRLTDALGGLLVSSSEVALRGHTKVDNNTWGGIELTGTNPTLIHEQGTLQNSTESYKKPTVWADSAVNAVVKSTATPLVSAEGLVDGQTHYYLKAENGGGVATNVSKNTTHASVQDAIDKSDAGDTIRLEADVTLDNPTISVTEEITIDGDGRTVFTTEEVPSPRGPANGKYNAAFIVLSNNVEIKNVTIDGADTNRTAHGIVVDKGLTGAKITNVTAKNGAAGVVANGAEVTVTDVTTSNNSWYGINVDKGARLTVNGTSHHDEDSHIFIDNRVGVPTDVVIDTGLQYVRYWSGNGYSYVLDLEKPKIGLSADSDYNPESFKVEASDDQGLSTIGYSIWKNGVRIGVWDQGQIDWNDKKSFTETKTTYKLASDDKYHPLTDLEDGEYKIYANATDARGKSTEAKALSFIVDNSAPAAPVITGDLSDGTSTTRTISGTAEPGSIVIVTLGVLTEEVQADENGNWSVEFTGLGVGKHSVSAVAKDAAGNVSTASPAEFTILPVLNGRLSTASAIRGLASEPQSPAAITGQNAFGNVFLLPGETSDDDQDDNAAVLGAQTDRNGSSNQFAAAVPTADGWKIFGLMWYWWLLIVAAIAGAIWFIAAARRRRQEDAAL